MSCWPRRAFSSNTVRVCLPIATWASLMTTAQSAMVSICVSIRPSGSKCCEMLRGSRSGQLQTPTSATNANQSSAAYFQFCPIALDQKRPPTAIIEGARKADVTPITVGLRLCWLCIEFMLENFQFGRTCGITQRKGSVSDS